MKIFTLLVALLVGLSCTLFAQECRILSLDSSGKLTYWVNETNLYVGVQYSFDLNASNSWINADLYDGFWNIEPTNQTMSTTIPLNAESGHMFIKLVCSTNPLPEAVIGSTYDVYGGDSFSNDEPEPWRKGYNPAEYGYTLLGSATNTSTFAGNYNVYIVRTARYNLANVDALHLSDVGFYQGYWESGDTLDNDNCTGIPDGEVAVVGGMGAPEGGYITIFPYDPSVTGVTVHVVP